MKVYGILGLCGLIAVGIWWLVGTVQENERLTINNATLTLSNESYVVASRELREDMRHKEAQAVIRTEKILELNQRILRAQNEVRVITETVVTEVERECLVAPVPNAIIDFMLDQDTGGDPEGSG